MNDFLKFLIIAVLVTAMTYVASMFSSFELRKEPEEVPVEVVFENKKTEVAEAKPVEEAPPSKEQIIFECTAYDLSVQSCGKLPSHPAYGITASGVSLRGKTREMAMAIAVDPNIIPMGSNVYLEFDGPRAKYNGVYTAVDTGGAIKGRRIDVFFGDTANVVNQEALEFGRASARVTLL